MSCRNEDGKLNHQGWDGRLVTLLIRDKSVPSFVGYTKSEKADGQGDTSIWILKTDHL